ncbi:hypothetical protein DFJ73DRAFT_902054 [Zopfochytrium polystomum]|nr:hypothetical protein DFJ73DRAFT_902054 [Zopfochytrium polystomum]
MAAPVPSIEALVLDDQTILEDVVDPTSVTFNNDGDNDDPVFTISVGNVPTLFHLPASTFAAFPGTLLHDLTHAPRAPHAPATIDLPFCPYPVFRRVVLPFYDTSRPTWDFPVDTVAAAAATAAGGGMSPADPLVADTFLGRVLEALAPPPPRWHPVGDRHARARERRRQEQQQREASRQRHRRRPQRQRRAGCEACGGRRGGDLGDQDGGDDATLTAGDHDAIAVDLDNNTAAGFDCDPAATAGTAAGVAALRRLHPVLEALERAQRAAADAARRWCDVIGEFAAVVAADAASAGGDEDASTATTAMMMRATTAMLAPAELVPAVARHFRVDELARRAWDKAREEEEQRRIAESRRHRLAGGGDDEWQDDSYVFVPQACAAADIAFDGDAAASATMRTLEALFGAENLYFKRIDLQTDYQHVESCPQIHTADDALTPIPYHIADDYSLDLTDGDITIGDVYELPASPPGSPHIGVGGAAVPRALLRRYRQQDLQRVPAPVIDSGAESLPWARLAPAALGRWPALRTACCDGTRRCRPFANAFFSIGVVVATPPRAPKDPLRGPFTRRPRLCCFYFNFIPCHCVNSMHPPVVKFKSTKYSALPSSSRHSSAPPRRRCRAVPGGGTMRMPQLVRILEAFSGEKKAKQLPSGDGTIYLMGSFNRKAYLYLV